MSLAVLFSGQGHQHPGMLPWLADDPIVRPMAHRLQRADWRAALEDRSWAQGNRTAQVLLTGTSLAAWHQLSALVPAPVAMAGYSVGELAAFSGAGCFDAETALDLAVARAMAMDRCAARHPGGLMGVTGLQAEEVAAACAHFGCALAIRNGCFSVVIGGPVDGLDRAAEHFSVSGARCTRLNVTVPSHTPSMQPASEAFALTLSTRPFSRPATVLFANATGQRVGNAEAAREALSAQIAKPVKWSDCLESIRARRPACVVEIGAGQALARMWNDRYPDIPARSADEFRSVQAIAHWVGRSQA